MKSRLSSLESDLSALQSSLETAALRLPNSTSSHTPIGPEGSGRILEVVGTPTRSAADHLSFGLRWQLFDFDSASRVVGSRFYYLQHELALLELALVQYTLHFLVRRGWSPILPPDLVQRDFVNACGFQPRDLEETKPSQIYHIEKSPLALAGTAEIPLVSQYHSRTLPSLAGCPVRLVGFSHSFRTEAGGHGAAVRGLYRVHQFSKVEMVALTTPEESDQMFDEIVSLQRELYSSLGLTFRLVEIPSEDLGAPAFRKVDCEAWMPGRGAGGADQQQTEGGGGGSWGEISSASHCTDYQARRLGIRHQQEPAATTAEAATSTATGSSTPGSAASSSPFVHTLNGTAAAIPRLLIAILEQLQSEDGQSVRIPDVLQPYMIGCKQIPDHQMFPHRNEVVSTTAVATATQQPKATMVSGKVSRQ